MSMVTQCPNCATTFRVVPQQLQAQHGMVRCGRCATVFDGFKTLATLPDTARAETTSAADDAHGEPSAVAAIAVPAPPTLGPKQDTTPARPVSPAEKPVPHIEPKAPLHEVSTREPQRPTRSPVQAAAPAAIARVEKPAPPIEPSAPPHEVSTREPPPPTPSAGVARGEKPVPQIGRSGRRDEISVPKPQPVLPAASFEAEVLPQKRGGAWAFGVIVLLIALAAQGIYFYRSEIAAQVPEATPYLNKMCELLRCTVSLPQRPRSISIEASDMQAIDPANPGLIALTATLRNHATTRLGYPALDVVLTNTREHTVARRIFSPSEYLDSGNKDARAGIPPNAEITVKLNIDSGDLGAAGFRLDLLAAPTR